MFIPMRYLTGCIRLGQTYHWGEGDVHNQAGNKTMQLMEGDRKIGIRNKDRSAPREIHGAGRTMGGSLLDNIIFCGCVELLRKAVSTNSEVNNNCTFQR